MSKPEIIGSTRSTYTRVVRMVCEEKGIDYTMTDVLMGAPELNAIHPFGRMPVLRHGDLELFDVETGSVRKVTITERNLRQYRQIFDRFQGSVGRYCTTYGLSCTRATTDVPFDQWVLRMMRVAGAVR